MLVNRYGHPEDPAGVEDYHANRYIPTPPITCRTSSAQRTCASLEHPTQIRRPTAAPRGSPTQASLDC
jgi:hypothetical protein